MDMSKFDIDPKSQYRPKHAGAWGLSDVVSVSYSLDVAYYKGTFTCPRCLVYKQTGELYNHEC